MLESKAVVEFRNDCVWVETDDFPGQYDLEGDYYFTFGQSEHFFTKLSVDVEEVPRVCDAQAGQTSGEGNADDVAAFGEKLPPCRLDDVVLELGW